MRGLVEADLAAARKQNLRHGSPPSLLNRRKPDASFFKRPHVGREVIAHEVQLRPRRLRGMHRNLRWRSTKDQPTPTRIDVFESKHIGQEGEHVFQRADALLDLARTLRAPIGSAESA